MVSESVVTEHEAERQKLDNKRAKRAKEEADFFASEGLSYPKSHSTPQAAEKKADAIVQDALATIEFAWNYEPFMAALCISWAVWCRSACLLLVVAFTLYLFVLAVCAWRRYSQCEVKAKIAKAGMHVLHQQQAMMQRVKRMNAEAEQDEAASTTSSSAFAESSSSSTPAPAVGIRQRGAAAESMASSEQVTFSAAEATEVKLKMENLMVISSPASVALHRAIAMRAIRSLSEFVGVCAVCAVTLLYVQYAFVGNALLTGSLASGARLAFETTGSADVWYVYIRLPSFDLSQRLPIATTN